MVFVTIFFAYLLPFWDDPRDASQGSQGQCPGNRVVGVDDAVNPPDEFVHV